MKPRLVDRIQGKYRQAAYAGANTSGINPIGKRVLVLTDEFEGTFAEGKLEFLPTMVESMNSAAESGTLVAIGSASFSLYGDGSKWTGEKPVLGDSVYFDKYAGLMAQGNDGKKYRLMEDSCIGATYTVHAEEGADTNAKK